MLYSKQIVHMAITIISC